MNCSLTCSSLFCFGQNGFVRYCVSLHALASDTDAFGLYNASISIAVPAPCARDSHWVQGALLCFLMSGHADASGRGSAKDAVVPNVFRCLIGHLLQLLHQELPCSAGWHHGSAPLCRLKPLSSAQWFWSGFIQVPSVSQSSCGASCVGSLKVSPRKPNMRANLTSLS